MLRRRIRASIPTMRTRALGRSGFAVSEIGFGAWGLGGDPWRDMDPRDAQRALFEAVDAGIAFIDTAPSYGASEMLVGQVVRELRARDRVVVATKVQPAHGRWLAGHAGALARAFPPAYVVHSVEQSLRTLRAEVLHLAQLQVWDDDWLDESAWPALRDTMQRLIKEGKVLRWGVCLPPGAREAGLRAMDEPLLSTIQVTWNIFEQRCAQSLLPRAQERELGVIARAPLDEGALAGALADMHFQPGDFRARYFHGDRQAEAARRAEGLRPCLGDEARTLAELALRFCLSSPAVSTVIPGMRQRKHVHHNMAVSDGRGLSAPLLERLREQAWERDWYALAEQAADSQAGAGHPSASSGFHEP